MLHLLPEEHRQKVVNEYRKRVILIFLLGLFFVSIVSAVFVSPTFFLSYGRYADVSMKNQMLDSELAAQAGGGSAESIKDVTISIEALRMFDNAKSVSVILDNIVRQKANGVQIKNLIFTPGDNFSMTIDLAGRADTRKSLVAFDENLKGNSLFDEVIVPLGSFAKDKNIDFSMKLVVSTSTRAISTPTPTPYAPVVSTDSTATTVTTATTTIVTTSATTSANAINKTNEE